MYLCKSGRTVERKFGDRRPLTQVRRKGEGGEEEEEEEERKVRGIRGDVAKSSFVYNIISLRLASRRTRASVTGRRDSRRHENAEEEEGGEVGS